MPRRTGLRSLISSGKDPYPSFFLGSSADGANVFFGTHAKLVAQDTDSAGDIYDARICTESAPCFKAPAGETAQCEGGACQTPPPAPAEATPFSLTSSLAGNLVPQPAPSPKKTAAQLKAEKLDKALKVCKKDRSKKQRASCEASARKNYGPPHKAKKTGKSIHNKGSH